MCKHPKGHKFQKFDDTSLFCERCGERRVVAAPTWVPDWTYRPPQWWPNTWYPKYWPPYIVTSVTSDSTSDFTVWNDAGASTVQSFTNAISGPQTQTPRGVFRS